MLSRLSLRNRMLVSICSIATVAFALTVGYITFRSFGTAERSAHELAKETAGHHGRVVQADVERAMDTARTLANVFEGVKAGDSTADREGMNAMLRLILDKNPMFLGVWTCWEPDSLDGLDMAYMHAPGHDETGRFVPYWRRSEGEITVEPLVAYDTPGDGDYYLLARDSEREVVLNPYFYQIGNRQVLISTVSVPVVYDGKVAGVVGIDIEMGAFQALVANIRPFGSGYSFLVSNDGTFVAHPAEEIVGRNMNEFRTSADVLEAVSEGLEHAERTDAIGTGTDSHVVFTPIPIGASLTPWSFAVSIPIDAIVSEAREIMYVSISIGVISLILLLAVVFFIARSIAMPINRIAGSIDEGTDQVASAAGQVSSASQSLAEGSSEQAASIEETSASLEEMSSMIRQNADNARQADTLMGETKRVVSSANQSMESLTGSMTEIAKASEETSKIVKTIDEIAFQTNLLALNAAVEAARAGEAGAGFAVVADEVRNLAMRAAEAAKNTSTLIEGTVKKVKEGSSLVSTTNEEFHQVAESAVKVADLVSEIAAASSEQAQGIDEVNKAVTEMDKVTQSNAANAEESASASEELNAQAVQMQAMVADLMRLVDGAKAGGHSKRPAYEKTRRVPLTEAGVRRKAAPAPARKTRGGGKEVDPNKLIPLDDEDFKNF